MPSRIIIKLASKQRKKFKLTARRTKDALTRVRSSIILKYAQGKGSTTIARELECSHSTPHRVGQRFLEWGEAGLVDGRCENGTTKADEICYAVLIDLVAASPQDYGWARTTWTLELLSLGLEAITDTKVGRTTMSRMLKRLRARKGRPKPVVGCPWPTRKRRQHLRQIEELAKKPPPDEVVLYEDEVDIHLNPKIGSDWMLRGQQKIVVTPGKNEKHYVAGAWNTQTRSVHYVVGPSKRSFLFVCLLRYLAYDCYPDAKRIHVIVDNYSIHHSQITQTALKEFAGRVELHFLPPYCPDDNPIEHLWKQLHENVTRNHRCEIMDELMDEVHGFLQAASPFPGSQVSLRRTG